MGQNTEQKNFSFKSLIKPNAVNVSFTVIIFSILMVSIFSNLNNLPRLGGFACESLKNADKQNELREELRLQEDTLDVELSELVGIFTQIQKARIALMDQVLEYYPIIKSSILNNVLAVPLTKIDPFFPSPCETFISISNNPSKSCRTYINEEDYNCIKETTDNNLNIGTMLYYSPLSEYNKVNIISLIIHLGVVLIAYYLLFSSIIKLNDLIIDAGNAIRLSTAAMLVLILIFAHSKSSNAFFPILLFSVIFVIEFFIRNKLLRVALPLFIGIVWLIVVLILVNRTLSQNTIPNVTDIEYKGEVCKNPITINETQKLEMGFDDPREWKICDSDSCNFICETQCNGNFEGYHMVRGQNPACICGCILKN